MANRIDAILSGVGSIDSVGDAHIANASCGDYADLVRDARRSLSALLGETPACKRAAFALACSVINSQVESHGDLFGVDDKCVIQYNYFSNESQRRSIAGLLFD